jgi:hypothetical protein
MDRVGTDKSVVTETSMLEAERKFLFPHGQKDENYGQENKQQTDRCTPDRHLVYSLHC